MKTNAVFTRPIRDEKTSRQIALRTRGHSHGPCDPAGQSGRHSVNGSSRSSFSTTSTPIQRRHQNSAFIPIQELRL